MSDITMRTAYIVSQGDCSDSEMIAAFSTRELAQDFIKQSFTNTKEAFIENLLIVYRDGELLQTFTCMAEAMEYAEELESA